jgi:endonuclease-3
MELHEKILTILELLSNGTKDMPPTLTTSLVQEFGRDPFIILISCLLSLRAKDSATYPVSKKLFAKARTPQELLSIPIEELEELFYTLGFYRRKALAVRSVSQELIERFQGKVPHNEEELLSIKGVGRKTAQLVLGSAFNVPTICIDTHVHRIANRLGWVETSHVDDTERELKRLIPQKYWLEINTYLVLWGQNICAPISPKCSKCVLSRLCPKVGVGKRR